MEHDRSSSPIEIVDDPMIGYDHPTVDSVDSVETVDSVDRW